VRTTAPIEGRDWSAKARGWAELWAGLAQPARAAVADATGIADGTRLLDIGCGSGEMCQLAAARGAIVAGIDAAEGMIAIARERLPEADLRVGPMEQLPWADDSFDVVTAFNALQFAADFRVALQDAVRVVRRGGLVAICNWARR
jgi:ubiquinone/menaquinone biosynthesis C-methylase UbiE